MSSSFTIASLGGDGIGPEVVAEGVKVLRAVESLVPGVRYHLVEHSVGAGEYLRHGDPLPSTSAWTRRASVAARTTSR